MHAVSVLHKVLRRACSDIHLSRLAALLKAVSGVLNGRRLSIAGVGRALPAGTKTKHRIKCIDRLAGNVHFETERPDIYRALTRLLLGTQPHPVILVDWSDARADRSLQLLRASVVVDGRSMTLYEEVHPLRNYDNPRVRQSFLARLADCLPTGCRPVLVTDAGFRVPWYRQVEERGWDWIGRVRGRSLYRHVGTTDWQPVRSLEPLTRTKPKYIGDIELTCDGRHRCRLYGLRLPQRGRTDSNIYGGRRRDNRSRACARRHTEPWLLATSLLGESAKRICALYRTRTQIEGTFRDLKNAQWGLNLRAHRTRSAARLAVLILIGTLAMFAAFLTGLAAYALRLQREYQANTTQRRVLSYIYLGLEMLRNHDPRVGRAEIRDALLNLRRLATGAAIT